MSAANKLIAKRWFEEVWNQQKESAIDELSSPTGKCYGFPDPDSALTGPEAFKESHRAFCTAFPDLHVDVEDIIAEGDRVAIRWKVNMTHKGDSLGFPASGKKGTLHGSSFILVRDGHIRDGWNLMDMQALLTSLRGL